MRKHFTCRSGLILRENIYSRIFGTIAGRVIRTIITGNEEDNKPMKWHPHLYVRRSFCHPGASKLPTFIFEIKYARKLNPRGNPVLYIVGEKCKTAKRSKR